MKSIICYKSHLGATKTYANWLSEEIGAETFKFKKVKKDSFREYDTVVILSGTYIGRMPLVKFLIKHWDRLKGKKVIVVAVGGVPKDDPASKKSYETIPENIRKEIKYFKIPGAAGKGKSEKVKKENLDEVINAVKN